MLKDVRLRCTFASTDSGGISGQRLAVLDKYAHVLKELPGDVENHAGTGADWWFRMWFPSCFFWYPKLNGLIKMIPCNLSINSWEGAWIWRCDHIFIQAWTCPDLMGYHRIEENLELVRTMWAMVKTVWQLNCLVLHDQSNNRDLYSHYEDSYCGMTIPKIPCNLATWPRR